MTTDSVDRAASTRCNAILFDLDGTLIDSAGDIAAAVNQALGILGCAKLPCARIRSHVGNGAQRLMEGCMGARSPHIEEAVELFRQAYLEHPVGPRTLFPAVPALLEALAPRALAVVTNKPTAITLEILARLELSDRFDLIAGAETWPERKPSPLPLLRTAAALGVPPAETAMVGDSPQDIQAAKAAGMCAIAVLWGFNSRTVLEAHQPDFMAADFDQLGRILARCQTTP